MYLNLFAFAGDNMTGDISPAYAPLAPDFIQHANRVAPNASILMFVRNPFERNVSQLANIAARKLLGPKRSANQYQKSGATLTADMLRAEMGSQFFLRQSQQALAIRRWREVFGERVNVFFYDEPAADPVAFLDKVTRAIGRQSRSSDEAALLERANPMLPISPEDVATVREAIRPMCEMEIADLNSELGPIPYNWNQSVGASNVSSGGACFAASMLKRSLGGLARGIDWRAHDRPPAISAHPTGASRLPARDR